MEDLPHFKKTWVGLLQNVLSLSGANSEVAFTPNDLRAIQTPVSLIWGREDFVGSVQARQTGAEYFPDAEFHVAGVGHLPWLDEPETCGKLVRAFLARHGVTD